MTTDSNTISTNDFTPQPLGQRGCEVLLIAMVFFVFAGDPVPHVNEAHYLCRLKHFWNPNYCEGDLFLESPEAHLVFAWSIGWMSKWLSLTAMAWVGRILAWALLAWAWQRLSWRIVAAPLASVLSAALWVTLTQRTHLAGEWVIGGVEAKCFAYGFVLVALRELVDGRWNRAWLALGVASAFHALVGGWSVVVCAGIWLWERLRIPVEAREFVRPALSMLPGLAGGGLIALIGVVPALMLTWNETPEIVAEANRIYVFERLPHHLAPLMQPVDEIVPNAVRHVTLIVVMILLAWIHRRASATSNDGLRLVACYAWGAVALSAIGFAIEIAFWSDPTRAAALLRYYWFRLSDVAVPLAVALQVVAIVSIGIKLRRPWGAWALAASLLVACASVGLATLANLLVPIPPADVPMRDYQSWVDVCDWVATNTPENALFLTPRRSHTFKWRASRPEVATRKDIPQDARGIVEWFDRLRTIYYENVDGEQQPALSLGHLGTERIVNAARKYGADYVLTDNRRPLELPIVYPNAEHANATYVVYRVTD